VAREAPTASCGDPRRADFEYEFQMALMNRNSGAPSRRFLMPHEKYTYISSRLIKEVASFGTSCRHVPPIVDND